KREVPVTANLEPKALDRSSVSRHAVVAGKATDHRTEPLSLFGNRRVHTLSQFGFDFLKFPVQPFANRLAGHRVHSLAPLLPAYMHESQEVECLPVAPDDAACGYRSQMDRIPRVASFRGAAPDRTCRIAS